MKKIFASIEFLLFYIKEVVLSNIRVAYDVLTPTHHMNPKLLHIDIERDLTDTQITILANLITMTPGTLSIDVAEDRKSLFIHAMFIDGDAELEKEINQNYVRRILNVF